MTKARTDLVVLSRGDAVHGWTALNRGMRDALVRQGVPHVVRQRSEIAMKAAAAVGKLDVVRRIAPIGRRRLVTLSWGSDAAAIPDLLWCEIVPWIYDCWGPQFARFESMLQRNRIRLAFFSARSAGEHFAKLIPGLTTRWLPECMDLSLLSPSKPLAERSVHVLEMGRRVAAVHEKIRAPLEKAGKVHLYDKAHHGSAIPGLAALYERMGDSAVVTCFPKSVSHPDGAGGVETVTQRYFETIGSGSLAVGYCPKELNDLFGFNPVIELSTSDPAGHMLEILGSLPAYQAHADRALARVKEVGGFDVRAAEMLRMIDEFDAAHVGKKS